MTTTLTLIIPTYNLGSYFAGMLGALQRQTRPFDLWLVDDGSTDGTANQAEAFTRGIPNFHHFAFPSIKACRQPVIMGWRARQRKRSPLSMAMI